MLSAYICRIASRNLLSACDTCGPYNATINTIQWNETLPSTPNEVIHDDVSKNLALQSEIKTKGMQKN